MTDGYVLHMQRRVHVWSGVCVCVTVAGQKLESQVLVGVPIQTICKDTGEAVLECSLSSYAS